MSKTTNPRMKCKTCRVASKIPAGFSIAWMEVVPVIVKDELVLTGKTYHREDWLRHSCGKILVGYIVEGKTSDKVTCGDKCLSAIGPACECSCSGENHGIGSAG